MRTLPTLRPYQREALAAVRAEMKAGRRRVCLVLPTGAGKTITASTAAASAIAKGGQVLWLAHRNELVDQGAAQLLKLGLHVGTIAPSSAFPSDPSAPVQVASVGTLLKRPGPSGIRLIIPDECHHFGAGAEAWTALLKQYDGVPILGLTATPCRGDGTGLAPMFDGLVVGTTVRKLIDLNAEDPTTGLVPCEIVRPGKLLGPKELAREPVDAYRDHGEGRQAILFATTVDQAERYAGEFRMQGIRAACVHDGTPSVQRAAAIDEFRAGRIRVLTNVYVFTEGTDLPMAKVAILAGGGLQWATYIQKVGRVLRPYKGQHAKLIDLRGVSHYLGPPEEEQVFSLTGRAVTRAAAESYCPVCGVLRGVGEPGCSTCGWKPDITEIGAAGSDPTITNDPLVKFARKIAEGPQQRWETLCRWIDRELEDGSNPKRVYYKWKAVYGVKLLGADFQRAMRIVVEARKARAA